jgi:hypothetical protein
MTVDRHGILLTPPSLPAITPHKPKVALDLVPISVLRDAENIAVRAIRYAMAFEGESRADRLLGAAEILAEILSLPVTDHVRRQVLGVVEDAAPKVRRLLASHATYDERQEPEDVLSMTIFGAFHLISWDLTYREHQVLKELL